MKFQIDAERFWAKVTTAEKGCWLWRGSTQPKGYGTFRCGPGAPQLAHRIAWILIRGEIPNGLLVLHKCDVPGCVRPSHLFVGDHAANMADMSAKGRHWAKVHPEKVKRGDAHYYRQRPEEIRRGEAHGSAKLSAADVKTIRLSRLAGATYDQISSAFGISRSHAHRIVMKENWVIEQRAIDRELRTTERVERTT